MRRKDRRSAGSWGASLRFNGAASRMRRKVRTATWILNPPRKLQWGRLTDEAESLQLTTRRILERIASMGPPHG